jgi:hypothetical protein
MMRVVPFPIERLLAALLLTSLGSGCGSDDEAPVAFPGCEHEQFTACDIFTADCQSAVFSTVACLRGGAAGSAPPLRSITASEYREELLAEEDTTDDVTLRVIENALVMFEMASPGEFVDDGWVDLLVETVPAFYASDDDRITLVDSGLGQLPGDLTLSLVHEYVHALQDQQVDLVALQQTALTTDAALGQDCVVEGEATLIEAFFSAVRWGLRPDEVDFRTHFMAWVDWAEEEFAEDSPVLATRRYFPYTYGARYVYNVYQQGGMAGVRSLLETPPAGTRPVVLSVAEVVDAPVDTMDELTYPAPAAGYRVVLVDSLGAWLFSKFLRRGPAEVAARLAPAWRGDRLVLYADEAGEVATVWRIRLDAAVSQLRAYLSNYPLSRAGAASFIDSGDDLLIVATTSRDALNDWIAAAAGPWDAPLEPEPDGTSDTPAPPASLARALGPRWRRRLR